VGVASTWLGLGAVLFSAFYFTALTPYPSWWAAVPVVGAALIIGGGAGVPRGAAESLLSLPPFRWLGKLSYSLYLWHWPIINLYSDWKGRAPDGLACVVIVIVSVLLAWLTKIFVEDKIRLSPRLAGHGWRSVSVALAAAVPVAVVSVYLASSVSWNGQLPPTGYPGAAALADVAQASVPAHPVLPPIADAAADMPLYWQDNCLAANTATTEKVCVFGDTKNPVLTVAMVGDSVDGNWFPSLEQLALQRHWKLVTDLHGTCEWTATLLIDNTTDSPYTACQQWGEAALHDVITTIKPDVVITSGLPEDGTVAHPVPETPAAFAEIGAGMATYWDDLEKHGISVVAIRETPFIGFTEPDCLAKHSRTAVNCMVPTAKAVLPDPPTYRAASDTGGKVKVINMDRFICGPAECDPVVGNVLVYLDGKHLTATYAKSLTKYLKPRLLHAVPLLAK